MSFNGFCFARLTALSKTKNERNLGMHRRIGIGCSYLPTVTTSSVYTPSARARPGLFPFRFGDDASDFERELRVLGCRVDDQHAAELGPVEGLEELVSWVGKKIASLDSSSSLHFEMIQNEWHRRMVRLKSRGKERKRNSASHEYRPPHIGYHREEAVVRAWEDIS